MESLHIHRCTQISAESSAQDSESRLSQGRGIILSEARQEDLELIPGVSGKISEEFLRRRESILGHAIRLPYRDRHRALESIRGVGKKMSRKLAPYLDFNE